MNYILNLNSFIKRWSTSNYKRMMCLEESFYKDYVAALMSIFHEYFHFLFENGLSTEEFKMLNDKTKESEFNSYTKELMIQLLAANDNKFFSKEEDLKKAYNEFEDTIETKKNLLQICNDEKLILDTLVQYNKSYKLKESFNLRAEIDMLTLRRTKPLYTTTLADLEKFIKTLEKNLGKTREQIFQEINESINNFK